MALPAPEELWSSSLLTNPRAYGRAPWFNEHHVVHRARLLPYVRTVDGVEILPGVLPLQAVDSFEWRRRLAIRGEDLGTFRRWFDEGVWFRRPKRRYMRSDQVALVERKLYLLKGAQVGRGRDRVDLWCARNRNEEEYLPRLFALESRG